MFPKGKLSQNCGDTESTGFIGLLPLVHSCRLTGPEPSPGSRGGSAFYVPWSHPF